MIDWCQAGQVGRVDEKTWGSFSLKSFEVSPVQHALNKTDVNIEHVLFCWGMESIVNHDTNEKGQRHMLVIVGGWGLCGDSLI